MQYKALIAQYEELLLRCSEIEISINNKLHIDETERKEKRQKMAELKTLLEKKKAEIEAIERQLETLRGD